MRAVSIVALALTAILVGGCIAVSAEPTPTPTLAPTEIPMITPAPTPPPATPAPTQGPPTPTPDPNATPEPTALDIAPYLTSEITVVNLGVAPLMLTVALLDPESTDEFVLGTFELQPEQVSAQSVIPTLYRLDFDYAGTPGADAGTCTINIADGEQVQFGVIESGIVITTNGSEPVDPAEMLVETSSRCHYEAPPA